MNAEQRKAKCPYCDSDYAEQYLWQHLEKNCTVARRCPFQFCKRAVLIANAEEHWKDCEGINLLSQQAARYATSEGRGGAASCSELPHPHQIKINDGTLDVGEVKISTVPFIRFRKSLATNFPQGVYYYLEAANKARERTVFVVNADSLPEFLKNWKMETQHADGYYTFQRVFRSTY